MVTNPALLGNAPAPLRFGPRRAVFIDASRAERPLSPADVQRFESFDLVYRTLCGLLYNYVPMSGHPGGSISSGRFVQMLAFGTMEYDLRAPLREDADILSYAAGHKALGLYALWALRNEIARLGAPALLPDDAAHQLRLEDLLGFRHNPDAKTPLTEAFHAKALDGHPTPATPFVRVATGASGVGLGSSVGLALAAADVYGKNAPRVHVVEGEGGLTPGRVSEALAIAGTASLGNLFVHLDWNQSSIDSDRVCREGTDLGDYVQWEPAELFFLHDWNVVYVPDGKDFQQIAAAQKIALEIANGQPTAIVYRTVKGWQYGVEGRASHGAGHKLCSPPFLAAMERGGLQTLPRCEGSQRCEGGNHAGVIEECFWDALRLVRGAVERDSSLVDAFAWRLISAKDRLEATGRVPRSRAPFITSLHEAPEAPRRLAPGEETTLRGELARVLAHYNAHSGGALMVAAADLLGSTSIGSVAAAFPKGFYNAATNPDSRVIAAGICEDAIAAVLSGLSAFGHHAGVGASYAAFLAPLAHIAARLHAIGEQARQAVVKGPYRPMILACAHAGLKTGEDGATHADPQALQLLQENFPLGTSVTLTPWEPLEIAPLFAEALAQRPAVIAPFVTRPSERVLDREALSLAPPSAARKGLYKLRAALGKKPDATLVLQGSAVTYAFVQDALPELARAGLDVEVFYVSSAELFARLPVEEQRAIFSESQAQAAMGITDFTLPTLFRWITSSRGREASLHPFSHGRYPGSGAGPKVLEEAGLDGAGQVRAIRRFIEEVR